MSAEMQKFIEKWRGQVGKETGNLQPFLIDLCDALGLQRPGASEPGAEYCFEYSVPTEGDDGYTLVTKEIDLYKKGHFILEGKQTPESARKATGKAKSNAAMTTYDKAVAKAFGQAKRYAEIIAVAEAKVPFLIVCDVGVGFYVWDSFSGGYGRYASRRAIAIEDLARPDVQEYLRAIWTDPESLNPNAVTAAVTREIASGLGELKVKLASTEHDPKRVALFLMRVVFTFFAEDIGLLPQGLFSAGLALWERKPDQFQKGLTRFWETMNEGGQYGHDALKQFNGDLFKDVEALPLTWTQIRWMRGIADKSWKDLDPSIFGALLEGALDPTERKRHGVHYTPRAHIQRLIDNTFGRDLWAEWEALHQDAQDALDRGQADGAKGQKIKQALMDFRKKLGTIRILDPACGSGNFLYVAFDTLKRIEEEVIATLELFGETKLKIQAGPDAVTPRSLMGIELDDWAASIAELVIWIAYVQWYFRLYPQALSYLPIPEPVLQNYDGIKRADAVLAWACTRDTGRTRWGGRTMASNITGRQVPDPSDQVPIVEYLEPAPAEWPVADYIVGNPPFLGKSKIREMLGDGYAAALRTTYLDVPDTVDLVMYWWHRAALEVREGRAKRFGLITTNSITQLLHRDFVNRHLRPTDDLVPLKILWAAPDHPWGGTVADVRIAMTVGGLEGSPRVAWVTDEGGGDTPEERADSVVLAEKDVEAIHADLRTGVDTDPVQVLKSNAGICSNGVSPHGGGFHISEAKWVEWGRPDVVRPYMNGRDLVGRPRGFYIIDLYGLGEDDVKRLHPQIWQHLYDTVKPERDQNNRQSRRENWWLFGELGVNIRLALDGLSRFIVTVKTAKHRAFAFVDAAVVPDDKLIVMASDDAYVLGVLSSKIHAVWFDARCGRLVDRRVYNKTVCFDPFPFPDAAEEQKTEIRALGEALDAHVKATQARGATITEMYNLVEALRADPKIKLSAAQRLTHERAATTVLLDLHARLDAAAAKAYGWADDLSDEEILTRLTALNAERAQEETNGKIRWLRPEYQAK
jgi:hypothetical protein